MRVARTTVASVATLLLMHADTGGAVVYEAIASVQSTADPDISGTVRFSQAFGSPCVHVSAEILNLPDGLHGFHVHQFGDLTSDTDKSSVGAHFTPICADRRRLEFDDAPEAEGSMWTQCYNDSIHGMPPSNVRQSGDMGNIESVSGVATYDMDLCQEKMSLYDEIKSILGRSVVVHSDEDTGNPPFGLAGEPIAAGAVGLYNTNADPDGVADGQDNGALPPTNPAVERVMCYVRGAFNGPALIQKEFMSTQATVHARLALETVQAEDVTHSFHFHAFGDLDNVGPIWQYAKVNITDLPVPADTEEVFFCEDFTVTADLSEFVGRILTVHSGPTSDSPTVASGVCGLAHPDALVSCSADDVDAAASSTWSSVAGVVAAAVTAAGWAGRAT